MRPLGNRIIIIPDKPKEQTDAGLVIPVSSQQAPRTGVVEKIGEDVKVIKPGDRVVYSEHAGTTIEVDGVKVLYIKETDCHFVL